MHLISIQLSFVNPEYKKHNNTIITVMKTFVGSGKVLVVAGYLVGMEDNTVGVGRVDMVGSRVGVGDSMVDSKVGRVVVDMLGNCWVAEPPYVALVVGGHLWRNHTAFQDFQQMILMHQKFLL